MKQTLLSLLLAFFAVAGMAQKVYNENLIVTINGTSTPEIPAAITVMENADGTCSFVLKNFHMLLGTADIAVGNVSLDKVALTDKDAYKEIATEQTIRIQPGDEEGIAEKDWFGPTLGDVPVKLSGKYNDSHLYANIDIDMSATLHQVINVKIGKEENVPATAAASFALANGDFNGNWVEGKLWDSTNGYNGLGSIKDETWAGIKWPRSAFITPEGWCISNVIGVKGLGATLVGKKDTIEAGNYAVSLVNTPNPFMSSQIVPAYLTLGTSWATADGMGAIFGNMKADGGSFGGVAYSARPDSITFRYKRTHGEGNADEDASVVVYLWKGSWSQAEVPGETYLGSFNKVTMYNRDRNILGLETAQGGAVTKSADAQLVGVINDSIEGNAEDWTVYSKAIDYSPSNFEGTPDSLNIILSSADYFGDRTKIGSGNTLTVDDVKLVFAHSLKDITVDGKALDGTFDENNVATVAGSYEEGKTTVKYTKVGIDAKVSSNYDTTTKTLTIRVEGADFTSNPTSFTEYGIRFAGGSTGIDSVETESASSKAVYTISGVKVSDNGLDNLPKGVYIVGGKKVVK